MSLFRRTDPDNTAVVQPPGGLPDGYDDPRSDFFVPEALRQYWPPWSDFAINAVLDERMVGWARHDIASERYRELAATDEDGRRALIGPTYYGDRFAGWDSAVPEGKRLPFLQRLGLITEDALPQHNHPDQVPARQRQRFVHAVASEFATRQLEAVQQAQEAVAAQERWTEEHRCEFCEDVDQAVSVVTVIPGHQARVDPGCQGVLAFHNMLALADREVNGRTLGDLAEEWLRAHPAVVRTVDQRSIAEVLAVQERQRIADPEKATFGERALFGAMFGAGR